jgi:hypothetical protein
MYGILWSRLDESSMSAQAKQNRPLPRYKSRRWLLTRMAGVRPIWVVARSFVLT